MLFAALLAAVTFHTDVEPVLRKHCQSCHARGEIGPMPLVTYKDVRPWAAAVREAVKLRRMPPWFADPKHGEFANNPSLTEGEIRLVDEWVRAGAPEGPPVQRSTARARPAHVAADLVLTAAPVTVPAGREIDYQYIVLPPGDLGDRWVNAVEIRPGDRSVVHHAVLYVREPQSAWLRDAKPDVPWTPSSTDSEAFRRSRDTKADILAIYSPGAPAAICPEGMARKLPAGSDLVLQMHYTSAKRTVVDRTTVRLRFTSKPSKRILTLQMGRDDLRIPPGDANYRASVTGSLPGDALLISMFPHMHLRGAAFDYDIVGPNGQIETLLRVKPYRFDWQLNYVLTTPRVLLKGTILRWTGYFDNSRNNPFNPDPAAEVTWGEQSREEMMIGFFDVAVDPDIDKHRYFDRKRTQ
jgi:hypothetical protein